MGLDVEKYFSITGQVKWTCDRRENLAGNRSPRMETVEEGLT